MVKLLAGLLLLFPYSIAAQAEPTESVCYGTSSNGHLQEGWQLPESGVNFQAYSAVGVAAGRNYVHSQVYRVVTEAYALLHQHAPDIVFVYGETGFREGGRFHPHKTHQNGLSVDFFVPVLDHEGRSAVLPSSVFNKLGYGIEFDQLGRYQDWTIDFAALALHLQALATAAQKHHVKIQRVIFDNELQTLLFKQPVASRLRQHMTFSTKKPWVRHDEHYHVDFVVPCQ